MMLLFDVTLCVFLQPLIDCAICYKTFAGKIEKEPKPYVHCLHKPALTEVCWITSCLFPLNGFNPSPHKFYNKVC